MPKLTKDSLVKRFSCPHCGKSIRTRQGLSGHIQFKHAKGLGSPDIGVDYIVEKGNSYETVGKLAGVSLSEIHAKQNILVKWLDVKHFNDFLGMKVNSKDFKDYVIARLACRHEVEGLKIELTEAFRKLLEQHG